MDRGAEPGDLRLPATAPRIARNPGAPDQIVELRTLRSSLQGGRPLFLHPERRVAESERALHDEVNRGRTADAAAPEHSLRRRHGRPGELRDFGGWESDGLRALDRRLGLARMAGARHPDGPRLA